MKLYLILREDIFNAIGCGQLPDGCLLEVGPIWAKVRFTEEQRQNYRFSIANL
jgi:hypothetical protein